MSDGKAINEIFRLIEDQNAKIEKLELEFKRLKTPQKIDLKSEVEAVVDKSYVDNLYRRGK